MKEGGEPPSLRLMFEIAFVRWAATLVIAASYFTPFRSDAHTSKLIILHGIAWLFSAVTRSGRPLTPRW